MNLNTNVLHFEYFENIYNIYINYINDKHEYHWNLDRQRIQLVDWYNIQYSVVTCWMYNNYSMLVQ